MIETDTHLYVEMPEMPDGLKDELNTIEEALLKIDFQINDDDKHDFYILVLNDLYDAKLEYSHPEYKPKKYFKVLLKEIKKAIHWSPGFVQPL